MALGALYGSNEHLGVHHNRGGIVTYINEFNNTYNLQYD